MEGDSIVVLGIQYFVFLFLIALIINSVFHAVTIIRDSKANKSPLIQMVVAFVFGVLITLFLGRGVLSALGISPSMSGIEWLVTGLVLAAGSDSLNVLQSLAAESKPEVEGGAVPETVQVSGQIRVRR